MVNKLEEIKGYTNLNPISRIKFMCSLKAYLDSLDATTLSNSDILSVKKHRLGYYKTVFTHNDIKYTVNLKFNKSMIIKS